MVTYDDDDGLWLSTAYVGGVPTFSAYMPPPKDSQDSASVTVFWCGKLSAQRFTRIVEQVETLYAGRQLVAYGPTRESKSVTTGGLSQFLHPHGVLANFDAYRAEFDSKVGGIVVWGNVAEVARPTGEDMAENVGITLPRELFDAARGIIADAIRRTACVKVPEDVVYAGLNEISQVMEQHQ
jgi:hypothetical protein